MTGSRLYVTRDEVATVISRERLRVSGARLVDRPWTALVETTAPSLLKVDERRSFRDAALVAVPPVAAGAVIAAFGPIEAGFVAAGVVFFGMAYLEPVLRRRRGARGPKPPPTSARILTAPADRAAFDRAVDLADSISETWPRLGSLIDATEAEPLLAEALWGISGVLARRQRLTGVLTDLSRPDFAAHAPANETANETARELRTHLDATKKALSDVEIDLAHREANLRRAEQAGRDFIREQEMRQAIRAAQESLHITQHPELLPAGPTDPGADLAEHTRSVLDAYRELTTPPPT